MSPVCKVQAAAAKAAEAKAAEQQRSLQLGAATPYTQNEVQDKSQASGANPASISELQRLVAEEQLWQNSRWATEACSPA